MASLREDLLASTKPISGSSLGRLWQSAKSALDLRAVLRSGDDDKPLDAQRLAQLVARLGELRGIAMKAGQMLAYVDAELPAELRTALAQLQRAAPTTPFAAVAETLRAAWGERAEHVLLSIDPTPIAAASIGQVHRGRLPDGTEVAIKVRHPGIEAAIAADFRSAILGSVMGSLFGGAAIPAMIAEAEETFLAECDFANEAAMQRELGARFAGDADVVVPRVFDEWSTGAVLVSQFVAGTPLVDYLASDPSQASRDRLGGALFRFWMQTLYETGLFHADPHPGNFAVDEAGRVIVYDFGCVRAIDPGLRRGLGLLAAATRRDDAAAIAAAIQSIGAVPPSDERGRRHLHALLRAFFGSLLRPGRRPMDFAQDASADVDRSMMRDKRAILALRLPARMLFLFRLRFGLFAVLQQIGAEADWAALESGWARAATAR